MVAVTAGGGGRGEGANAKRSFRHGRNIATFSTTETKTQPAEEAGGERSRRSSSDGRDALMSLVHGSD